MPQCLSPPKLHGSSMPPSAAEAQAALAKKREARRAIEAGERDYRALEQRLAASLAGHGFDVDYVTVANADSLVPAGPGDRSLVVAAAARLGRPRLIDNVTVKLAETAL